RMLDVPKDLPDSLLRTSVEGSGDKASRSARSVSSVTPPPVQFGLPGSQVASGEQAPRLSANLRTPGGLQDGSSLDRRLFSDRPQTSGGMKVPNFVGMTMRAVLQQSAEQGLPVEVAGDGIARAQDPPPGSRIAPNGQVRVQFGR